MLDIDHGTYPFVTSSSASAGGACTGTGVPPTRIQRRHRRFQGLHHARRRRPVSHRSAGRARATRSARRGNEFGAVTGRPRRCGWFDVPAAALHRHHQRLRQPGGDQARRAGRVRQIPVCVGYRVGGQEVCGMPPTVAEIAKIEPVYECLPGWNTSTFGISNYERTAGASQGLPGLSGSPHRRRSGLHLHRPGAQPDHRPPRLPLRKTGRVRWGSPSWLQAGLSPGSFQSVVGQALPPANARLTFSVYRYTL